MMVADRSGKAIKHNPGMHAPEQSDCVVVPENRQNKIAQAMADAGEGRAQAKENPKEETGSVHRDRFARQMQSGGYVDQLHGFRVTIQGRSRMR